MVGAWGDFVFAQPRLQARHAAILEPGTWIELEQIADYGQFLQSARQTALASLVHSFGTLSSIDEMEIALRSAFGERVVETASWLPGSWQSAVLWVRALPLLPFRRPVDSQERLEWMRVDPQMKGILSHLETDEESPPDAIGSVSGTEGWLRHWRGLWPESVPGLDAVGGLLTAALLPDFGGNAPWRSRRAELREALVRAFRGYAFGPGAAIAHLGLVGLELGRLRGNLSARRATLIV